MTSYKQELLNAMKMLNDNNYYFIGQSLKAGGTSMFWTVNELPQEKRIELPVFEDIQMGMSIGMNLSGMNICSIYPRWDFMLLGINQLVNHMDKIREMSDGQFNPKVIIRVAVGSSKPLMPGPQHSNDYTEALKLMVTNIDVLELKKAEDVMPAYKYAMNNNVPTVLVEYPDIYNQEMTKEFIKARKERK